MPAWADRPLVSETADVIERGACQTEAQVGNLRASGSPKVREWGAVFTCGIGLNTQPALAYARASESGFTSESLLLGAKTNFRAPENGQLGFGVAYSVDAIKSGAGSWRSEGSNVTGLLTMELGRDLLGHANLGVAYSRSAKQNSTTWALGVETVGDFTVAADLFGDDRNRPAASAGVGYSFNKSFSANAAYAVAFETPRVRFISLGAKLVF
jgi:predicted porin